MRWKRLFWQLYPSYILVILISLFAVALNTTFVLNRSHLEQTASDLEVISLITEDHVRGLLQAGEAAAIDEYCKELGRKAGIRVTVIEPSGIVIGDSAEDPALMERHDDRPEIRQALRSGRGESIRFSSTVRQNLMYVAVPLVIEGKVTAVVRTSLPMTSVSGTLRSTFWNLTLGGLVIAAVAGILGLVISRRIARPLEEMKQGAERFSSGDFSRRLPVADSVELGGLAESLNEMAEQLDERIRTALKQRGELETILASMVEGVIAVDRDTRILSLNRAAAMLLSADLGAAPGKMLQEVVRNRELQRFVSHALESDEPVEGEIILHHDGDRYLQAHGTRLGGDGDERIGALVVLNDVTRMRKLETFRRDFVANVSHELRTPITSIKGFVETLADGALEDSDRAMQFLGIINKHTDRLSELIEDLLTLSRLDQGPGDEGRRIAVEPTAIHGLLEEAIEICRSKAESRFIEIKLSCQESLEADLNQSLVEQALVNLIDNAIKYSPERGVVDIEARTVDERVVISVRDNGIGIDEKHAPRLFERFYRVDKARSRDLGGTGLGLAIVKHVAQAHGGSVGVDSSPGSGSTFFLYFPAT
jgi:two-component system phosphate regulon sensor histidine kinase PhoR